MLIIQLKDGENIDRALKRYRNKFRNTKQLQELRTRKEYIKPSVKKRIEKQKAQHKQNFLLNDEQ